ncbi:MAG: response regulator [Planctomycetota bacterium]
MDVLIVDDSRAVRAHITRMMQALGANCTGAGDGREALEVLSQGSFELALIDWNMPELDGYGLLQELAGMPQHGAMKKVMCTSVTDGDSMVKALDAGADDYLMKPFDQAVLADKLRLLGLEVDEPSR